VSAYKQKVDLQWKIEMDVREWGIKDLHVSVPDQDVTFHIQYVNLLEQDDEMEVTLTLEDIDVDLLSDAVNNGLRIEPDCLNLESFKDGKLKVTLDVDCK
jgi:hypothetical protein